MIGKPETTPSPVAFEREKSEIPMTAFLRAIGQTFLLIHSTAIDRKNLQSPRIGEALTVCANRLAPVAVGITRRARIVVENSEVGIGINKIVEYFEHRFRLFLRPAGQLHGFLAFAAQDKPVRSPELADFKHDTMHVAGTDDAHHGVNIWGFRCHAGMVAA